MDSPQYSDPADPESVPTISDLITRHRDVTGDSYRDMASRAASVGLTLKHQTIAELARSAPKGWPKNPETISALAYALKTSERAIVVAFARSFGLDMSAERKVFDQTIYRGDVDLDILPREFRAQLLALVQEAVDATLREREGGDDGGDTAATKHPEPEPGHQAGGLRAVDYDPDEPADAYDPADDAPSAPPYGVELDQRAALTHEDTDKPDDDAR